MHIGKETYRSASGSTQEVMEISMVIDNLSELHDSVKELWDRETGALETRRLDLQMAKLVDHCSTVYTELSNTLAKCRATGSKKGLKFLSVVLRYAWKEHEIKETEKRILKLQALVDSYVMTEIR